MLTKFGRFKKEVFKIFSPILYKKNSQGNTKFIFILSKINKKNNNF